MVIIRPTADLAKRMKIKLVPTSEISSTKLGDWYAVGVVLDRQQFILAVSSTTRLAVVLNAAPYSSFPKRLSNALHEVLAAIGVSEDQIRDELEKMSEIRLAKTESRSILGTLNEYHFQLDARVSMGRADLSHPLEMSLHLNRIISLVLPEGYPRDEALKVFGQAPRQSPLRVVK